MPRYRVQVIDVERVVRRYWVEVEAEDDEAAQDRVLALDDVEPVDAPEVIDRETMDRHGGDIVEQQANGKWRSVLARRSY